LSIGDYKPDSNSTNLIIENGILGSGSSYTIKLEVTNDIGTGWGEFSFTVNDRYSTISNLKILMILKTYWRML